jgi:hypothetical protein
MSVLGRRRGALRPLALLALLFLLGIASSASAAEVGFGFESTGAEESTSVAGLHPDFTTSFVLSHQEVGGQSIASGRLKELSVALPPGLVGDPTEFPRCSIGDFNAFGNCPVASQVGVVKVHPSEFPEVVEPLYNLQPGPSQIARFGFYAFFYPIFIDVAVRTGSDYGVTATVHDASGQAALISAATTLWGVPADPGHDEQRLTPFEAIAGCPGTACLAPEGKRSSGLSLRPFMSNPSACGGQEIDFTAGTYQAPGQLFVGPSASVPPITGCQSLPFDPSLQLEPTSHQAGAPTGLNAVLRIPQSNAVNLPASSAMRAARVTLPEGMTLASGAASGLKACSDQEVGLGREVDSNCPDNAKLGVARLVSPALPEALQGGIYQRTPEPGNPFRIWLVTDEFGLHLKIPGEIKADRRSGRLTAEFRETPQLPVEEIDLRFKGGDKAPLRSPDACGSYSASYEFTPWSGNPPTVGITQPVVIDRGCNGAGFSPKLEAGEDGEDNVSSFDLTLPKGELAKLKGVPLCAEAAAASGACPAASQIGTVAVAAGPGAQPLWLPQPDRPPTGVFLAGPYKGAPYSVVTKVPVQAGPFDLGTVVVRSGLYVDPKTARVTAKTDALPQILEGVPILYRTIHIAIDRDRFAISPTNCRQLSVAATIASVRGALASPRDRFQVGECAALGFRPKLALRLKGPTRRSGHPALRAVVTYPKKGAYANIAKAQVDLPHSEFLDQGNIRTVCTQPDLKAGTCPPKSIYGRAKAWSPLLDKPLEGPVYLGVGYGHKLPDLVADLDGQIRILLNGKVDTGSQGGLRSTFAAVPDAPVSKFVLELQGGPAKGLLQNSENVCSKAQHATAKFTAQNGRVLRAKTPIATSCASERD